MKQKNIGNLIMYLPDEGKIFVDKQELKHDALILAPTDSIDNYIEITDADYELKQEEAKKQAEAELAENIKKLEDLKINQITLSKLSLANWLQNHPYSFTRDNGKTDNYTVTEEKQQYLALEIQTDSMALQAGQPCTPSWSATGKVCEYDWTITELIRLAWEMRQYIKPRISKQQHIEADILACATRDEVLAISVDENTYDNVEVVDASGESTGN